jgi:hypothetical protein
MFVEDATYQKRSKITLGDGMMGIGRTRALITCGLWNTSEHPRQKMMVHEEFQNGN